MDVLRKPVYETLPNSLKSQELSLNSRKGSILESESK